MKRSIDKKLKLWKDNPRRKPLIVRGARQVGKTWSIKKLGSESFDNTVHLDFEKNRDFHSLFENELDAQRMIRDIEVMTRQEITPGKTLLFLDEIQACSRAIMSLRYFYEEMGNLHVIAAGSLLEFALSEISFPVGRIQYLQMGPMSFAEFLLAGHNQRAIDVLESKPEKLPDPVHEKLLRDVKTYFFVGGMPESVKTFYQSGSLLESFAVQKELIYSLKDDFGKYTPHVNRDCLEEVITHTARSIGQQVAYTRLSHSYSHPTLKKAFDLLVKARLVQKVLSVGKLELPLDVQSSSRKFKALMMDIGIWQQMSGASLQNEMADADLMDLYRGALAEQFVGQEMAAWSDGDLYYWARHARNSTAEVDYILPVKGRVYPIEVKSGSAGSLKSLHLALKNFPQCPQGIIFSTREYGEIPDQKLTFLPLYYSGHFMKHL